MSENDRLKQIRTEKGYTLAQFGEKIGLTPGAISDMERGRRGITEQTRNSICREFKVNREWLLKGTGDMFLPDSSDELDALAKRYNLPREIQIFIEKLVTSDDNVQRSVVQLLVNTSAAIIGENPIETSSKMKTFEEMSALEIAEQVEIEREKEKGEKSDPSSSTA